MGSLESSTRRRVSTILDLGGEMLDMNRTDGRRMNAEINVKQVMNSTSSLAEAVKRSLDASFANARRHDDPYRHWLLRDVFPSDVAAQLRHLPFSPPQLDGVSGKRELHNDKRRYFDAANNTRFPQCGAVAEAFQSPEVVEVIRRRTGEDLSGTYVRLEYAQDVEGFWLEPHTDLGVKKFTMLIYLSDGPEQADLGTDIYRSPGDWVRRTPFDDNSALIFVPGGDSWHGLEPRPIHGVRKSVIMNYVTDDWRAREQLAYPATPVRA
jgi:hypothetical protein